MAAPAADRSLPPDAPAVGRLAPEEIEAVRALLLPDIDEPYGPPDTRGVDSLAAVTVGLLLGAGVVLLAPGASSVTASMFVLIAAAGLAAFATSGMFGLLVMGLWLIAAFAAPGTIGNAMLIAMPAAVPSLLLLLRPVTARERAAWPPRGATAPSAPPNSLRRPQGGQEGLR